jgi:hypothetical protein
MRSNRNPYFSLGHDRPATELPLTLADLHLSLSPEDEFIVHLGARSAPDWSRQRALDLVTGAGFLPRGKVVRKSSGFELRLKRIRSLPDTVGPNMQVLIIGLNPSPYSADTGIGYGRPGNRFWPAALKAGLVSIDRDPRHALSHHGVGMTDLVRRTTARADEDLYDIYLPLIRHEQQLGLGLALRKETLRRQGVLRSAKLRDPGPSLNADDLLELQRLFDRLVLKLKAANYLIPEGLDS